MKKIILVFLGILLSSSATAEWTRMWAVSNGVDMYVDLNTIRKNGDIVKLWTMQNLKTPFGDNKFRHLSNKVQWELDCKEEVARFLAFMTFAGKKGTGDVVDTDFTPNAPRQPVPPGSVGERVMEVGCDATIGMHKWVLIDEKKLEENTQTNRAYFDSSSIRKSEDRISLWELIDVIRMDHDPKDESLSIKIHREYDCKGQQVRVIATETFQANMGVGRKGLTNNNPGAWIPIEAGNATHNIWKAVCET